MFDVVIAGGGIAGLSLALALRETFGAAFRIAVADPTLGKREPSVRASALTAGSRNLLAAINCWDEIVPVAQPILGMRITDSRRQDAIRPQFLAFDEPLETGSPFAYMVSNGQLLQVLEAKARERGIELHAKAVKRFDHVGGCIKLHFGPGDEASSLLLVGADGVNSRIRRYSGIEVVEHDYRRTAIVATLSHEEEHHGIAVQHFLPPGPFAMLPLTGKRSSIVWTERREDADAYLAMPKEDLLAEMEKRFGGSLGRLSLEDGPASFPLRVHLARRFSAPRIALIGDAAHLIHPLAGQGVNLAFRDIAALVQSISVAVRSGLDIGQENTLATYQSARFFDTSSMVAATHGLHRLFSNNSATLRFLRDIGLGVVDRMPRLKQHLIQDAAGLKGDVPALLRGQIP